MSDRFYVHRLQGTTPSALELTPTSKIVVDGWNLVSREYGEPPAEYMVQFKPEDWVIDRHNEILDAQQRGPLYVAVLRERGTDEVVGMCHGGAVRHDEDFKKVEGVGNRVELWTVSIKEEFLKVGGLGSMMLDDFFKWVRETSSQHTTPTTVMLISFECNLRSHRFYEKHGMRCAVVTSKMYSGRDTAIRVYTIDICSD